MLNSAALVDINGDNIRDIVIATFNSTVLAIDGSNFKTIWNVTFPNSESYSNIGKKEGPKNIALVHNKYWFFYFGIIKPVFLRQIQLLMNSK